MTLSIREVEHIANLARLDLTEEEKVRFSQQLSAILDYIAQLQELDTQDIPPTSAGLQAGAVLAQTGALRPDEPRPGLDLDSLLANAPQAEADQFRVPPVLE